MFCYQCLLQCVFPASLIDMARTSQQQSHFNLFGFYTPKQMLNYNNKTKQNFLISNSEFLRAVVA